ncbi:hypothetical protein TrVE_jg13428 [Triparma verrucosa]|uniref:Phosphodiesterase n=1 Tax=Triparma verrucosa TaxID=1606542 RepID=A0A9W7C0B6_9STRA|nr:hypothetical protein TrVE_jg13428 [Triparma verrucosa]
MTLQRKVSQRSLKAISTDLESGEVSSFYGFIGSAARVFNSGWYILLVSSLLVIWCCFTSLPQFSKTNSLVFGRITDTHEEYLLLVTNIQITLSAYFLVESLVVNLDSGIGQKVNLSLDIFLCLMMPFLILLNHVEIDKFPIVTLRVITLMPRLKMVGRFFQWILKMIDVMQGGFEESTGRESFFRPLSGRFGAKKEIPSDIPVLRLVQLLKRTIKSPNSIYTNEEKEELKHLLMDVVQHKIYSTTRASNTNDTQEEQELSQIKEIYTLGKIKSEKNIRHRRRSHDMNDDRMSGNSRSGGARGGRARGISAPVHLAGGSESLSMAKLSIQASVDNYLTEVLDEWDFNVFQLARVSKGRPLTGLSLHLFNDPRYDWANLLQTNEFQFEAYISTVEQDYGSNVYHNKFHGTDVTQSVHYFLQVTGLEAKLEPIEVFALIFSSIIHDFRHPGYNNAFLIKTVNELALTYNDRSPLENFHVSSAFKILNEDKKNFLKKMDKADQTKLRSMVIDLVLATDLKHHFDSVAEFKSEIAARSVAKEDEEDGERHYLMAMKMCLKCCDIGHPTKAKAIHLRWSRLIMQEFYAQGDEERRRELGVSPLCDRNDTQSIPKSQKGFINFLVRPLFSVFCDYLMVELKSTNPSVDLTTAVFTANLTKNLEMWEEWEESHNSGSALFDPNTLTPFEEQYEKALKEEFDRNDDINSPFHRGGEGRMKAGSMGYNSSKSVGYEATTSWLESDEDEGGNGFGFDEAGEDLRRQNMKMDLLQNDQNAGVGGRKGSLPRMNSKEMDAPRRYSMAGYGGKSKKFITSGEHLEDLAGLDLEMGNRGRGRGGSGSGSGAGGAKSTTTTTKTKQSNEL